MPFARLYLSLCPVSRAIGRRWPPACWPENVSDIGRWPEVKLRNASETVAAQSDLPMFSRDKSQITGSAQYPERCRLSCRDCARPSYAQFRCTHWSIPFYLLPIQVAFGPYSRTLCSQVHSEKQNYFTCILRKVTNIYEDILDSEK